MKRLSLILFFVLSLFLAEQVNAVTVYYQPTPYPLKRSGGAAMPQDLDIVHVHGGWINNYTPSLMNFQRDGKLKLGGWVDLYRSYLNFDLIGLPSDPTNVNLWLWAYPLSSSNTTPFQFCIPNTNWNTSLTWGTQPTFLGCTSNMSLSSTNGWNGWGITPWYQSWKLGTPSGWNSYGIMLNPQYNDNNYSDQFRSTDYSDFINDQYADGKRPILQFDFTPTLELKMPLPAGYGWLVTTEIGGYDCLGGDLNWPDTAHQNNNYFSIDISANGSNYTGGVPILAASSGKVIFAGVATPEVGNGYHVIIDHDGDGVVSTGFQTRYLHLASFPARKNGALLGVGSVVQQGDQIGVMGTTGTLPNGKPSSSGIHLHFGVRYQNNGASTVNELTKVIMEGLLLKSYQTECTVNSIGVPTATTRRYGSSITSTGN